MKKNGILKPIGKTELQEKIPLEWRMRKEVDELKSAMKDKGGENLDGMIRRTGSPFTTEPSPPTKIPSPIVGVI